MKTAILEDLSEYVDSIYIPMTSVSEECFDILERVIEIIKNSWINAVPHIPVRRLTFENAEKILQILLKKEVNHILAIWWSEELDKPDFPGTLNFLEEYDLKWKYGIEKVDLAAHPEWHTSIISSYLPQVLDEKIKYLSSWGKPNPGIITQMILSSGKINYWLQNNNEKYKDIPISVWVTIPPSWDFALRIKKQFSYINLCWLQKQAMELFFKWLVSNSIIKNLNSPNFPFSSSKDVISVSKEFPNVKPHIYAFWGLRNILNFLKEFEC